MFINLSILLNHVIVISRWHRLGISVKGNSVTAIIDCKKQQNREIKREAKDTIIHDGIILLAQQIDDNTFFEVCFFLIFTILGILYCMKFNYYKYLITGVYLRGICNNLLLLIIHKRLTNFALIMFLIAMNLFQL